MQASVKIVDWVPGAARQSRPELRLVSQTLTAGELIAQRIAAECRTLNDIERLTATERRQRASAWLVVPGASERALNGHRVFGPGVPDPKRIDPAVQIDVARKAFEAGRFVMLFDGAQIEGWDQRITVGDDSVATFIKLVPLQGG
jgi:hypothetical protein